MVFPKYYDSFHLHRTYDCPCGRSFEREREVLHGGFAGVTRAQDDGTFRQDFRPRVESWLYLARYEDAVLVEEAGRPAGWLPAGAPFPDFESLTETCPACGLRLPPERCPDCGAPAVTEERDYAPGAEGDDEWVRSEHWSLCPAGHSRRAVARYDRRHGN